MALRAVGALGGAEEPPQSPGDLSTAADWGKITSCLEVVQVGLHLLLPGGQLGQVLTQLAAPAQDGPPALLDHLRARRAVRPKRVLQGVDWTIDRSTTCPACWARLSSSALGGGKAAISASCTHSS